MNEEQFNQFLQIFQEQQKQQQQQNLLIKEVLQAVFTSNEQKPEVTNVNYASIAPFENYDPRREKFASYLERFENYYSMKGLSDKNKIGQLLCVSIGSEHYNNLSSFLGPEKQLKNLKYEDLVKAFKQLLIPKKNVVVSQHYFLNIFQKERQTITDFVASLQRDLAECEFSVKCSCDQSVSVADTFLRAQFIRGLRDNWLREQILQSNETTFDGILTKAIALEASKIESKELSQTSCSNNTNFNISDDVNKVSHSFKRSYSRNRTSTPHRQHASRSRNQQLHLKSLGIDNLCLRCGKNNHKAPECRIDKSKLTCNKCNRKGHLSKVCVSTLMTEQKKTTSVNTTYSVQDLTSPVHHHTLSQDYGLNKVDNVDQHTNVVELHTVNQDSDKYMVVVTLNGKPQRFEVDTGARFSLIAKDDFEHLNLNLPIQTTTIAFKSYSGNIIKPEGKVNVNVCYKGKHINGELHIVPSGHEALLGRQWIRALGIDLSLLDSYKEQPSQTLQIMQINSQEDIFKIYSNIFEEKIGCVPDYKVSLQLRDGAKPIFTRERNVPYALLDRVNKELDTLEKDGIISPIETSDWGSPLVVIPKADGGVRLCVDYKCGVNERLVQANHPIRRIDDVLHSLRNSSYFCKLDLYKAYLHLKVDEEASYIQTMSTHRGTYRVHRLSFGIKTAPSEFNRILSQILKGLNKTESYFDDIIVHGSTIDECKLNLQACLQRLSDYNLHVNKQKCSFFQEKIEYLGRVVEFNKISKSLTKIQAVHQMPRPSNAEEVKRLLGLVSYYSRFIPDASTITYPLRCLLQKNAKWKWTSTCEAAFLRIKSELCSDQVLIPFDPALPLVLTTDASPTGVAAVLSHVIRGEEKPIAYASRSLTDSERNYSQLDRESLAIIFGVSHFYYYLYGTHFTLVTDNAPISRIFQHNKALPQMTSGRLLRYASYLSGFNYTLKFKPGKENENVDCLSRVPLQTVHPTVDLLIGYEVNQICVQLIFEMSDERITATNIRSETAKDPDLSKVLENLTTKSEDSEYTLVDGILFRKDRVIIPRTLRSTILNELHDTHIGITKMKQLARRYVYWPNIDKDIEHLVKACEKCALTRHSPKKAQVHPWDPPENNWERVHIDYAGPFENKYFLMCVDAKSKWAEVKIIKDSPTSSITIHLLEEIFTSHGYPQVLVSDNATVFKSEQFQSYCQERGIFQKFIAPGHPATNGLAERSIQTLKNRLKAVNSDPIPIQTKLQEILFRYRATPLACGQSPAELYLHRKIRIRLDAIFPYQPTSSKLNSPPARSLQVGERVQARFFLNNKYIWKFGQIKRKLGKRHYLVSLDSSNQVIKRHINQLRSTFVQKKSSVSFGPPQVFDVPRLPRPASPQVQQDNRMETPMQIPAVTQEIPEQQNQPMTTNQRPQRERRAPSRFKDYVCE